MEKRLSARDVRGHIGEVLRGVIDRGDRYVLEEHGEAVAVVVPVRMYEQWTRARTAFFETARASANSAGLSPDEADQLAAEATAAARPVPDR